MQCPADCHCLSDPDVPGQIFDARLDQFYVDSGACRLHARSRQHLGLHVDAHARFHIRRESDSQRSWPASNVDQTFGASYPFSTRNLPKKAGRIRLAISGVEGNGGIEAAHVQSTGILAKRATVVILGWGPSLLRSLTSIPARIFEAVRIFCCRWYEA